MKRSAIWVWVAGVGLVALILYIAASLAVPAQSEQDLKLSDFLGRLRAGEVTSIEANGDRLDVLLRNDPTVYKTRISPDTSVEQLLRDERVDLTSLDLEIRGDTSFEWSGVLLSFLPLLLIVGLFFYLLRRRSGVGGVASQVLKSGAHLVAIRPDVTFDDVAGYDEAKEELTEVIDFLRNPERYRAVGARVPKGILLMGPPGTGKTYLARAVAGTASVPFFSISGSQFVELYVGVGAARVRDLFKEAKANAPCIVFIDELDAVGRQRGTGLGGGNDEREQTLNQILVEMDGFEAGTNVIVLAATNRPDILDPALIRAGRFDRQVILDRPDVRAREAILRVHARNKRLGPDVDLTRLARQTAGFVAADLENVLNEAALLTARGGATQISQELLEEAIDRVLAGPQRKSRLLTLDEKRRIAVHEAGHAIVAHHLPLADPVTKISIVPRGLAGGYTRFAPEFDRTLYTREELNQRLAAFLGGRTAEAFFLGDVSTGAEDDIDKATDTARRMVTRWGMSDDLGPRTLGRKSEQVFLGRDIGEQRNYSEHVAEEIDAEIHDLVAAAETRAREILDAQRATHRRLVELLLDEEMLAGPDLAEVLGPRPASPLTPEGAPGAESSGPEAPRPDSPPPPPPAGAPPGTPGEAPPPPRWSVN